MTYEQQCWRLVAFVKQLGVGFAGVGKRKGQDYWHFVVFTRPGHVVSATGPEQPKAPKSKRKSKKSENSKDATRRL
jgi:hypothetical protein